MMKVSPWILDRIVTERINQKQKHGDHSICSPKLRDETRLAITFEEVGEAAKAFLDGNREELIKELVQVAACAIGWLEAMEK